MLGHDDHTLGAQAETGMEVWAEAEKSASLVQAELWAVVQTHVRVTEEASGRLS